MTVPRLWGAPQVLFMRVRFALNLKYDNTYHHNPCRKEVYLSMRMCQWNRIQTGHSKRRGLTAPLHGYVLLGSALYLY